MDKLTYIRSKHVQNLGAGISRRNWQDVEASYNALRNDIDRMIAQFRELHVVTEHDGSQWVDAEKLSALATIN